MSCPSGIYAVNTNPVAVTAAGTVPVTTVVRRYGSAVSLQSNGVAVMKPGYYRVDVFATIEPTAEGDETLSLLKDGNPVAGAFITGNAAAAASAVPLAFTALVRQGCCCADYPVLTLSASAAGTVTNAGMVVTKL